MMWIRLGNCSADEAKRSGASCIAALRAPQPQSVATPATYCAEGRSPALARRTGK